MLRTVEGVFTDGEIQLKETPPGVQSARVLVTFLPDNQPRKGEMMRFGQFAGRLEVSDEDFAAAEWRGEREQDVL